MEELKFKLEKFEGPLDLLLRLISKNQIDIYDIPIALIFDQYMEHIEQMRAMDMEVAGEFITMAAELMLIKSRMLLPNTNSEEEEDPRAALAAALIEYKKAKEEAAYLAEQYDYFSGRMIKETDEIMPDNTVSDQNIELLSEAFLRIVQRKALMEQSVTKEPEQALETIIKKKVASIHEKVFGIMKMLNTKKRVTFKEIIFSSKTRSEIIASFVAVLEMVKSQRIHITDDSSADEIYFEMNDNINEVGENNG